MVETNPTKDRMKEKLNLTEEETVEDNENPIERFSKAISKFITHCVKINNVFMALNTSNSRSAERKTPLIAKLDAYRKLFEKSKNRTHFIDPIVHIFRDNQTQILDNQSDEWLCSGNLSFRVNGLDTRYHSQICLLISQFYNNSKTIDDITRKNNGTKSDLSEDINYADTFMLYLYRIFSDVIVNEDQEKLDLIVVGLEQQMGLVEKEIVTIPAIGGGIENVVGTLFTMAKNLGLELPDNLDSSKITSTVSQLINNEAIRKIFNGLGDELKDCRTPVEVLDRLADKVAPGTKQAIHDTGILHGASTDDKRIQ